MREDHTPGRVVRSISLDRYTDELLNRIAQLRGASRSEVVRALVHTEAGRVGVSG